MNNPAIENWFHILKKLWEEKDVENVGSLLSSSFRYYEDPFLPPLTSLAEVRKAWGEIRNQKILKLEISTLVTNEEEGSASYEFSYEDLTGLVHNSRGAYYVELDRNGKATEFRQWWVTQ